MSSVDNKNYEGILPFFYEYRKDMNTTKKLVKKVLEYQKKKELESKEYASKQASVDTDIANTSNGKGGNTSKGDSSSSDSLKNSLKIKRKNYSSMYSGAGRNIV